MKKFFAVFFALFFFSQSANAQHNWIYTGDGIEIYVEDTTIDFSDDGEEFSVTVLDKIIGQKNFHLSRFNFYCQNENWFYNITGKGVIVPVSKKNASGYILEFVEKILPSLIEEKRKAEEEELNSEIEDED